MTTRERTGVTFFVESFFLVPFCSFPSLLRPPRRSSGFPGDILVLPCERKSFLHLLRDPEGLVFPDLSGTFFSPSSDMLKQGGRKRSIRLARGKLKNFLVSNNQGKPVRNYPVKQSKRFLRFSARSFHLSLEANLNVSVLSHLGGEKEGGKEK